MYYVIVFDLTALKAYFTDDDTFSLGNISTPLDHSKPLNPLSQHFSCPVPK